MESAAAVTAQQVIEEADSRRNRRGSLAVQVENAANLGLGGASLDDGGAAALRRPLVWCDRP